MANWNIRFNEIPHSKPIRKFIESNLEKWINRLHKPKPTPEEQWHPTSRLESVNVEFFRSSLDGKIGCYVEIQNNTYSWRAFHYGKGIHSTFLQCLKHLNGNNHYNERSA